MVKARKQEYGLEELEQLRLSATPMPNFAGLKQKFTTREGWVGDANISHLFIPNLNPWSKSEKAKARRQTPFYGLNDRLPIVVAFLTGVCHALAMLAGVITPPVIFASSLGLNGTPYANYMIASSLIASGICSAVQMTRFKIPYTDRLFSVPRYFGTGLITVTGTSFATLSSATAIFNAMYADGTCPSTLASDGITRIRGPCPDAYGYLLGTSALCSLVGMALSFIPPRTLKRVFPPTVTGLVIVLIGSSLIGKSGFLNWAGGSGTCRSRPTTGLFQLCPNINAPKPLPWGSAQFLGLGFLSFATIIFVEIFGSPFMRNSSIIIALIVGMIVSGATGYVDGTSIKTAPPITFLWVQTFKLRIYPAAILPLMSVYVVLAIEAMADITASSEASREPTKGLLLDSRVSGGVLADGVNGLLSALFTNAPVSIFAQNSGVIVLTRCANRSAGYISACLLILFGVLAKLSGVFLAIPASVLGGVTTFLFASVLCSGLKVISGVNFTRRNRIVLASGLSLGMGTIIVGDFANYMFTYKGSNESLRGFMNAIVIILSTPYLIGALVAVTVNLVLPPDEEDEAAAAAAAPLLDDGEKDEEGAIQVLPQRSASGSGMEDDDTKKVEL